MSSAIETPFTQSTPSQEQTVTTMTVKWINIEVDESCDDGIAPVSGYEILHYSYRFDWFKNRLSETKHLLVEHADNAPDFFEK
jgi:hypothetical protein